MVKKVVIVISFYLLTFGSDAVNFNSYKSEEALLQRVNLFFKIVTKQSKNDNTTLDEDVTFHCATRDRDFQQVFLNDTDIESKLTPQKDLVFFIHGYRSKWHKAMKDMMVEYLKYFDSNVCGVDWERLSKFDYGVAARQNIFKVGSFVAKFVDWLEEEVGFEKENITLVGHSLGAHVSGDIGRTVNGNIGQIIALDPAGPLFTHPKLHPDESRLDKGDAKFLQVIYTSRHQMGIGIPIGHQNYFPNGGISPQPNCRQWYTKISKDNLATLRCSHRFAIKLLQESLNPQNVFRGRKCDDYQLYMDMLCQQNSTDVIGFRSNRVEGDFYLKTAKKPPYVSKD